MFELDKEQSYITEIAKQLGIETKLVYHEKATSTCMEKAMLLGWEPERVVKAVYFNRPGHTVGIVTPELERKIFLQCILMDTLNLPKNEAYRYKPKSMSPIGMEQGTCTPFPNESVILGEGLDVDIDDIIICSHPPIDDKLVDISLGGYGPEAHMASMHLPYKGIYLILRQKFGEKIHIF